jgi:uncharacterized protein YkwD
MMVWSVTSRRMAVVAIVAALLVGLFASTSADAGTYGGKYRERWQMLRATNESRIYRNLRRVELNKAMSDLARKHSRKMARAGKLFHTSQPATYYLKGKRWSWWGENVGVTSGTVRDVHKAFMKSSGHRANVLNRSFRRVAIGAVRVDGVLWVTVFFYAP